METELMQRLLWKVILVMAVVGVFMFLAWIIVENIRYHFFPIPYQIVTRGQLVYEDPLINEVRLWVFSSQSEDITNLPMEIRAIIGQLTLDEKIAVVIENQVLEPYSKNAPEIRRIIDVSSNQIHIESLLYRASTDATASAPLTYDYVVLTFDEREHWAQEIEVYLFNDEIKTAYIKTRIK